MDIHTLEKIRAEAKRCDEESLPGWSMNDLLHYLDTEIAKAKEPRVREMGGSGGAGSWQTSNEKGHA